MCYNSGGYIPDWSSHWLLMVGSYWQWGVRLLWTPSPGCEVDHHSSLQPHSYSSSLLIFPFHNFFLLFLPHFLIYPTPFFLPSLLSNLFLFDLFPKVFFFFKYIPFSLSTSASSYHLDHRIPFFCLVCPPFSQTFSPPSYFSLPFTTSLVISLLSLLPSFRPIFPTSAALTPRVGRLEVEER